MRHDVDDATLMQALRDADPLRGSPLDDRAHRRLEQSWREAMTATEGRAAQRWTIGTGGRTLQPIAVAIMAVVILASGVLVSDIVALRGAVQPAGVEGSFRARQHQGNVPPDTFLVAGGRALIRPAAEGSPTSYHPESTFRGVGEPASMRIEPRVLFDGERMYRRISANGGPFRWYHYRGPQDFWPPGLAETPQPVFEEGTRGFERVRDEDAQAKGLARYTADVDTADLEFLGAFSPTNSTFGPPVTTFDIWVDTHGRVHRLEERMSNDPDHPRVTRFDRFEALDPIELPYPEGADAPVADDVVGMVVYAYGDPALEGELRERLTAELEGDADVAAFELFERSAAAKRDGPILEDELFAAALRFTDDAEADRDMYMKKIDRLSRLSTGDLPANAQEVFRRGGVFRDPQGFAAIYSPGIYSWTELKG